jgi:hypothetical protein
MTDHNLILNQVHQPLIPTLSADGYIRLNLQQLTQVQLHHLHSSLYTEHNPDQACATSMTDIEGYTEWVSQSQPCISIGWDWQVQYRTGATHYSMVGKPFTNLLLQNNQQQDFSTDESLSIQAIWLNTLNWQEKNFYY